MLRNLENNVIFKAIITKKILHKSKKKTVYMKLYELFSCFPLCTSCRLSASLKWSLFLLRASDTTTSADLFCSAIRCTIYKVPTN